LEKVLTRIAEDPLPLWLLQAFHSANAQIWLIVGLGLYQFAVEFVALAGDLCVSS
jgi:hypothetical protein